MRISLSIEQRNDITEIAQQGRTASLRRRAHVILLYDENLNTAIVAERAGLSRGRTRYWRRKFEQIGMGIFSYQKHGASPVESSTPNEAPLQVDLAPDSASVSEAPPADSSTLEQFSEVSPLSSEQPLILDDIHEHYPATLRQAEKRRDDAITLFEATRGIHQLSDDYLRLLEAATLLQYLSDFKDEVKGSKVGYMFILSHPLIELDDQEQSLVECVLTYYSSDNSSREADQAVASDQKIALLLAALLRIALALDASGNLTTTLTRVSSTPHQLNLSVNGPQAKIDAAATKKAAKLWIKLTGQKVRVKVIDRLVVSVDERLLDLLPNKRPGVQPDDTLAEAGRKVLGFHFAAMLRHEEGTLQGLDYEELHDMRVATRRMRAAFEVFADAYDPKTMKMHLKGLRATGRALGRVRDLDVFMEKAQHYIDTIPPDQAHGLDPLLTSWKIERDKARAEMVAYLRSEQYTIFINKFLVFLTTPGSAVRPVSELTPKLVKHIIPGLIYTRLASVRAFEVVLGRASLEQLHALRIEFKKMRYSLEFFSEVLGKQASELIELIKQLQDHLGDLNDAEVACQIIRKFLDDWDLRQVILPIEERENPEPIVNYLAARHAERHQLMLSFNEIWSRFDQPEVRVAFAQAISVL